MTCSVNVRRQYYHLLCPRLTSSHVYCVGYIYNMVTSATIYLLINFILEIER